MSDWCKKFELFSDSPAMLVGDPAEEIDYHSLACEVRHWSSHCQSRGVGEASVVAFPAVYDLRSVSLFFALAECGAILVPLPPNSENVRLLDIAGVTHQLVNDSIEKTTPAAKHQQHGLYDQLRKAGHPGLVLFTSGSTGQPKAAVHDLHALYSRYATPRPCARMLVFMQMDHIGGVNTLLYITSHGGAIVSPASRSAHDVCAAIEKHRVQVLPTSPTFINMLLISGCLEAFDLTSLERITYGSEPMPQSVLSRITQIVPKVQMLQTYGTTELGILKSQSRENGSLWMKVGGAGYDVKIVDGRLWVRAATAMLGYLNAASPFDAEGFMDTGDQVEVDGDWLRILGRKTETINVGGMKVSPIDVESVLLEIPEVAEASVRAEPHPLTGQIVTAIVRLSANGESLKDFKVRMRSFCQNLLPPHAIPSKVRFADTALVTDRFKRQR
jgi:long-chain acyl-CoA synthetase